MPQQFDLIVFDWDGTLMDSAALIVDSLQSACRDLELKVPSVSQARHVIGLGLSEAIAYLQPDLAPASYEDLVARYRHYYVGRDEATPLFPGAAELVEELNNTGFMLAVATGKSRRGLDRALEHTGLSTWFHASRCADECFSKPHPEMLLQLMERLGAAPERTLMIGDTSHDLGMAKAAGVAGLAVSYGAHPRAALCELAPVICVDSVEELRTWLTANA